MNVLFILAIDRIITHSLFDAKDTISDFHFHIVSSVIYISLTLSRLFSVRLFLYFFPQPLPYPPLIPLSSPSHPPLIPHTFVPPCAASAVPAMSGESSIPPPSPKITPSRSSRWPGEPRWRRDHRPPRTSYTSTWEGGGISKQANKQRKQNK